MIKSKEKHQDILNKINDLEPKTQILSAVVPLNNGPVYGYTMKEIGEACQVREDIDRLTEELSE